MKTPGSFHALQVFAYVCIFSATFHHSLRRAVFFLRNRPGHSESSQRLALTSPAAQAQRGVRESGGHSRASCR